MKTEPDKIFKEFSAFKEEFGNMFSTITLASVKEYWQALKSEVELQQETKDASLEELLVASIIKNMAFGILDDYHERIRLLEGKNSTAKELKHSEEIKYLKTVAIKTVKRLNKELKNENEKLKDTLDTYRNKRGKKWRDKLYDRAKKENSKNDIISKAQALKIAFEQLPDKEEHRIDFNDSFKSISNKYYTLF